MIILSRSKKYKWRIIRGVFLSFFVVLFALVSFRGPGAIKAGFAGLPVSGQAFLGDQAVKIAPVGLEVSASGIIPNNIPVRDWNVENLQIQAPSAISVEIGNTTNKVLYSKGETEKLPIASLTKLMTALVVLENYNLDQKVAISNWAMMQEGEQGALKQGEVLSVKDLLYITLIESSNRSAYTLSEVMGAKNFIDAMNATAQRLELDNTHFTDSTGLSPQSYSSAENIAKLTKHLFQTYPIFNQIINTKEYNLYSTNGQLHHTLISTNKLLGVVPEVIGGKTGWTNKAKGCFVVVVQSPQTGNYIVHVVLGSDDRFLEIKNIIDWVQTAYRW